VGVAKFAKVDKVRVLEPVHPGSLAGANLGEHTKVARSAARRRALARKASASAADRVCRACITAAAADADRTRPNQLIRL
jgi:hypothetical protein